MKIYILGASGSGVTTLGKACSQTFGCIYFDSDHYFWHDTDEPFSKKRAPIERNLLLQNDLRNEKNWILGGSIIDWGLDLKPDLIVFLLVEKQIRIERIKKREFEVYGEIIYKNEDRAKKFEKFLAWASDYDDDTGIAKRTLKAHESWLNKSKSPIVRIIGEKTVDESIQIIKQRLQC